MKVKYLDINNLASLTKKLGSKQNCGHSTLKVPPVTLDSFPSTRPRSLFWFSTRSKIFGMHSQMLETFKECKVLLCETWTKNGILAPAVEPLVASEVKYLITLCYHIDGFCLVLVRRSIFFCKSKLNYQKTMEFHEILRVPGAKVPRTAQKNHSGVREVRRRKPRA